jgi:gamma-glutamyltranspeptidase/glutathione hydrolase
VITGARWTLEAPEAVNNGFNTWSHPDDLTVVLEESAPQRWAGGLASRGHRAETRRRWNWGHAQLIEVTEAGMLSGAADPRALTGAASGY